jgi:hypothetical protein
MKIEAEYDPWSDLRERIRTIELTVDKLGSEVWALKEVVLKHTHPGLFDMEDALEDAVMRDNP